MKKIFLMLTMLVALLQSCKKQETESHKLPRTVTSFRQNDLEIGHRSGSTASVVLISGYNSEMATWEKLYKQLDPAMTVFTYNRPGLGRSKNVSGKRDAHTIATELKEILEANNIKPPYVFVAHSMGGIYARMFYHQNPTLVKGLVLVDATHERQIDSLLSIVPPADAAQIREGMEAAFNNDLAAMPAGSVKEEYRSNFMENYQQMKQFAPITDLPVYVLTSTKITRNSNPLIVEVTAALHAQWAASAGAKGKFVATTKSGHYIQVEEPHLVAEGIRWVMQ